MGNGIQRIIGLVSGVISVVLLLACFKTAGRKP